MEAEPADAGAEAPRAEAGETVLVVEDEPVVRDLIVEVLRRTRLPRAGGCRWRCGPADPAIAQRIDLLVTDVGLPGGSTAASSPIRRAARGRT